MTALALAATALVLCAEAQGEPFPARTGESGYLDVPSAEVRDQASGMIATELRYERSSGARYLLGPSPLSLTIGLGWNLEVGLGLREGGLPGDPRPSPLLFSGVLKVKFLEAEGWRPALAVDLGADRINHQLGLSSRLVASTRAFGPVRFAAYAGVEMPDFEPFVIGPVGGIAAVVGLPRETEVVVQAFGGRQGFDLGGAFRWRVLPYAGLSLGVDWQPGISGVRASVGVAFYSPPPPPRRRALPPDEIKPAEPVKVAAVETRTKFRLRIRGNTAPPVETRHLHFASEEAEEQLEVEIPRPKSSPGLKVQPVLVEEGGPQEVASVDSAKPADSATPGAAKPPAIAKLDLRPTGPTTRSEAVLLDFPSQLSTLKPASKTALDALAVNAAARSAKVLVWAWVEPGSRRVAEAARRAIEAKRQLTAGGSLPATQIVAQVSTNRDVQGIQILVGDLAEDGRCPPKIACRPPARRILLTPDGGVLLGAALEAVALQFPTEGAKLRKADRNAMDLIALEGPSVEIHVWGRAREDLANLEHAGLRAAQTAELLVGLGMNEGQIVFDLSVQPDARGVEVLVTSHRLANGGTP